MKKEEEEEEEEQKLFNALWGDEEREQESGQFSHIFTCILRIWGVMGAVGGLVEVMWKVNRSLVGDLVASDAGL